MSPCLPPYVGKSKRFWMESAWDDALEEDVLSSQEIEHQHVAEAEDIRSDTSDDSDSAPSQTSPLASSTTLWWASRLQEACDACGHGAHLQEHRELLQKHPLKVISCCTGCSAECEIMKAWVLCLEVCSEGFLVFAQCRI